MKLSNLKVVLTALILAVAPSLGAAMQLEATCGRNTVHRVDGLTVQVGSQRLTSEDGQHYSGHGVMYIVDLFEGTAELNGIPCRLAPDAGVIRQ